MNGHPLPNIADIEAEAFVIAVATSAWTDRTVEKAAEWLALQAEGFRPRHHPQLDFAFLARSAETGDDGTFSALGAHLAAAALSVAPAILTFAVVCRVSWTPEDAGSEHTLSAELFAEGSEEVLASDGWTFPPPVRGGHRNHPHGLMPGLAALRLVQVVTQEGSHRVVLKLDDVVMTELPLNIVVSQLLA